MVLLLLEHGADLNRVTSEKLTALHIAAGGGSPRVVRALIAANVSALWRQQDPVLLERQL